MQNYFSLIIYYFAVGRPIEFEKIENPSKEEVEKLHKRFCDELIKFFEEEKYKYLKNAKDIQMEI